MVQTIYHMREMLALFSLPNRFPETMVQDYKWMDVKIMFIYIFINKHFI